MTTMTMTYVRNEALCNAGAIARLTALSPESVPSYRSSLPRRGFHVRVRTDSCTPYANAAAASVNALSSKAGVTPCQTASEAPTGVPATAVAAARSDPLRSDGATPTNNLPDGEDEWWDP